MTQINKPKGRRKDTEQAELLKKRKQTRDAIEDYKMRKELGLI